MVYAEKVSMAAGLDSRRRPAPYRQDGRGVDTSREDARFESMTRIAKIVTMTAPVAPLALALG